MKYEIVSNKKQTVKELIISEISRNLYGKLKEFNVPIFLKDNIVKGYMNLDIGDVITFDYDFKNETNNYLSNKPINIVFENDNYLVVNKEPHVNSIPTKKEPFDSLYNRLLYYFKDTNNTVHLINRLDKETSGLVLIAKNRVACCMLKVFNKKYYAKTKIKLKDLEGVINLPIMKSKSGIKREVNSLGKNAITRFKLISESDSIYTYEVILETGRTHQIRVHFSYLGSPLIGDNLYGNKDCDIMGLSCSEIDFIDPFTKEEHLIKIS